MKRRGFISVAGGFFSNGAKRSVSVVFLCLLALCGCGDHEGDLPAAAEYDRLRIVASNFVAFDFARVVAGERAEVAMLLPPGVEGHTFDPGVQDILAVQNSDLFVYAGSGGEPWAGRLAASLEQTASVDLSLGISTAIASPDAHFHGDDPHIWLNPVKAAQMVDALQAALAELDAAHAELYAANTEALKAGILALDEEFLALAQSAEAKPLVFGSHFAAAHFTDRYDLRYLTVYDSCAGEAEPSVQSVRAVAEAMGRQGLTVIYGGADGNNKVAQAIADETGATLLIFHALHDLRRDELETASYLSLMRENLENVRRGVAD